MAKVIRFPVRPRPTPPGGASQCSVRLTQTQAQAKAA